MKLYHIMSQVQKYHIIRHDSPRPAFLQSLLSLVKVFIANKAKYLWLYPFQICKSSFATSDRVSRMYFKYERNISKDTEVKVTGENQRFYIDFCFSYNHEFWRRVSSHEVTAFATGLRGQNSWLPMSWYHFCIKNISLWISSQVYAKTMEKIYYSPGNRLFFITPLGTFHGM